jgi:hypothetical protein
MQVKCKVDNTNSSQVEQCWSSVAGDGLKLSSLADNLPSIPPTTELAYDTNSLDGDESGQRPVLRGFAEHDPEL